MSCVESALSLSRWYGYRGTQDLTFQALDLDDWEHQMKNMGVYYIWKSRQLSTNTWRESETSVDCEDYK